MPVFMVKIETNGDNFCQTPEENEGGFMMEE
jgi:hypothetical protein